MVHYNLVNFKKPSVPTKTLIKQEVIKFFMSAKNILGRLFGERVVFLEEGINVICIWDNCK